MITTKIQIRAYLAEYINSKYYDIENSCVRFPCQLDIYHTIWDLTVKRPDNRPIDKGNVEICLPDRSVGKDPQSYNYLGNRSVDIIERRIEMMFFAELRSTFEENKHRLGISFLNTAHEFICKYSIESITPDALIKDYYRYRKTVLGRTSTIRKYTRIKQ